MRTPLRIVFFGTPQFAATSLQALIQAGYDVVAVVTAPDKPGGRGLKVLTSEVKKVALQHQIDLLQPTNLKSPEFYEQLKSYSPDLQVVIAFRMMPEHIWGLPPLGSVNLHASLLPAYRGAAPINHAIINGETETGLTTFFIEKEIDTGQILLQSSVDIDPEDDAGTLHDKLMLAGSQLITQTVHDIQLDNIRPKPQVYRDNLPKAPKIFPQDCVINWNTSSEQARNFIRGLSPFPGAKTSFQGKQYKIYKAQCPSYPHPDITVGHWEVFQKKLLIGCLNGAIEVLEIQQEGKKRLAAKDFLAGFKPLSGQDSQDATP